MCPSLTFFVSFSTTILALRETGDLLRVGDLLLEREGERVGRRLDPLRLGGVGERVLERDLDGERESKERERERDGMIFDGSWDINGGSWCFCSFCEASIGPLKRSNVR